MPVFAFYSIHLQTLLNVNQKDTPEAELLLLRSPYVFLYPLEASDLLPE